MKDKGRNRYNTLKKKKRRGVIIKVMQWMKPSKFLKQESSKLA